MALRRRVRTLFERRGRRRPSHLETRTPAVTEATLEAMFAYQHEVATAVPRQRRGAGRH
jgi:hypothetical protein